MTERRANMIRIINYSDGTIQPEALHPMLKNNFFSGDSPKDSALVTECDMSLISTFSAIVSLSNRQRMGSSCYLPSNCASSGAKLLNPISFQISIDF